MNSRQFQELQEAYMNVYQEIDEAKVDKKLPEWKRSGARLDRYDNPSGALALGGGQQRARRAEHEERRGVKKEEFDLYDIILSHLIDEGYASTEEAATAIMVNMSEDWRDSVVEAYKDLPADKMIRKAGVKQFKHGMSVGSGNASNPKVAQQVGKMSATALLHDPERAKAQSKMKKD